LAQRAARQQDQHLNSEGFELCVLFRERLSRPPKFKPIVLELRSVVLRLVCRTTLSTGFRHLGQAAKRGVCASGDGRFIGKACKFQAHFRVRVSPRSLEG
jgi:hypothetical protein